MPRRKCLRLFRAISCDIVTQINIIVTELNFNSVTIVDLNYDVKAYTYDMICNRKHEYLIACLNARSLVI